MSTKKDLVRQKAESCLLSFIRLVHPQRVLGSIHEEVISWWTRQNHKSHQLLLLPRDHQKSALVAYRVAWEITRDPTIRVLYISSTSGLATKQLKFIKDILTGERYRFYWPEMVNEDEGKREKWTETEISIDHPKRRQEVVRDPTVFTAGLTTGITGLHCDIAVLDDVVVKENAYTHEGRRKVQQQYSLLSSIESADAQEWTVGTRYHPSDLYQDLIRMSVDRLDKEGNITSSESLYEVFERQVENVGDGTGEFLWPRQQRYDGKWFGFNGQILQKKKAQYIDRTQFQSQYYNNPNDPNETRISSESFQYYDKSFVGRKDGIWYFKGTRLNVFAAIDFAFSLRKKADYSSIVVIGIDYNKNIYVLDIERFKTNKISTYFDKILHLHQKWDFRRLRAEVSVGQEVIVNDLKDNYIRPHGLALSVDKFRPTRHQGRKEERVAGILEARYDNQQIWHYRGGNCQILEEELILSQPSHDDVKDCLASAIDFAKAPTQPQHRQQKDMNIYFHSRFGGVG